MKKKLLLIILSIVITTLSCEYFSLKSFTEWEETNESLKTLIYSAGYYEYPAGTYYACYWENTKFHDLKDNSNSSMAFSIFIDDDDIYTAGYCNDQACLWKNKDEIYYLGNTGSRAWSVYIRGGVIYVAGYDLIGGVYKVGYWTINPCFKNIKQNVIIDNVNDMNANTCGEIFVDEHFNIYIAGTIGAWAAPTGFYYNSNKGITYYDSSSSQAHVLYVENGTVYVGGTIDTYSACYWKEKELLYTSSITFSNENERCISLCITKDNNIYLSCWGTHYIKNKSDIYAAGSGIENGVKSISIFNDTLYAAAHNGTTVGYTKGDITSANFRPFQTPSSFTEISHRAKMLVTRRYK